jgi:two-component system LytT family response regulator
MRIIIVDDEALARGVMREYLAEHADVEIVAECANGFEAVKAITELEPDLVFLDIQMPKLDGFEVAELVSGKTRFVFATAFDQYALKAFEVHALDYLLKPFSQQRLDQALAHARASMAGAGGASAAAAAQQAEVDAAVREVAAATRARPLGRVLIRDGARVHVIPSGKIDYIEAQDDYVQIHAEGKAFLKNQRMAELEEQLDADKFIRIHRSYLVNIECVARIEQPSKDSHQAVLHDGTRLPISRSGYQRIRAVMQ